MKNIDAWREQCYSKVPNHLYQKLKEFRRHYPYKKLTVGRHQWEYIDTGGLKQAVLILTGAASTGEANWESIMRHNERFRVISPSYPPVGTVDNIIEGLREILDSNDIGQVHIVSGSLGSAIGHAFIRRYPDRVDKLVLLSYGLPDADFIKSVKSTIRNLSMIPWRLMKRNLFKGYDDLFSEMTEERALFFRAYNLDVFENDLYKRMMIGHFKIALDSAINASELKMYEPVESEKKVLIIQAADDDLFNSNQRESLIAAYPGAEAYVFENGGHLLSLTKEDEINRMVDDFLLTP